MKQAAIFLALAFALLPGGFATSFSPPPVLNPRTYLSPSGEYALAVDPTDQFGAGPARYRLTRGGEEVWSRELPFAMQDAAVGDDGTAVGIGSSGKDEPVIHPRKFLHVAILAADGKLRLHESKAEADSWPMPFFYRIAASLLVHWQADEVTVRRDGSETWQRYRISSGEKLPSIEVRDVASIPEVDSVKAVSVAGTPLTLIQWWLREGDNAEAGALFTLLDLEGRRVWSLERKGDYLVPQDEEAEDRLRWKIQYDGAILDAGKPGHFDLWLPSAGERVRYAVEREAAGAGGWRVPEFSREKYEPPKIEETSPLAVEKRALPLLGSFVLADAPITGPIRDIDAFAFDEQGRIGFLRHEPGDAFTLVLVEPEGELVAEVAIPARVDTLAWIDAARWILTANGGEDSKQARAWWVDVEKGTRTEIEGFESAPIEAITGAGEMGFVTLANRWTSNDGCHELTACDAKGKQRWRLASNNGDEPGSLFSPEDIALTSDGKIAVLEKIRETVQRFDRDGKYLGTIDLKRAWGREPGYPSRIAPDIDGGFIVGDFNGDPPFVRMRADGSVRAEVRPRHASGRAVDSRLCIRAAPGGRVWASDGVALLRLDARGVVDKVAGVTPKVSDLSAIAGVTADFRGHLYAMDRRTGAVHVFDAMGKTLRVCAPATEKTKGNVNGFEFAAAEDGALYLQPDSWGDAAGGHLPYLRFGPDGKRLRALNILPDEISPTVLPQRGTDHLLVLGYSGVYLTDTAGKILRTIRRRPDRAWLDSPGSAAVAGDGAFAILAGSKGDVEKTSAICLYTASGEPIRTFPMPFPEAELIGFNGTHVVVKIENQSVLFTAEGKPVQRFDTRGGVVLTKAGRELWMIDFSNGKVERHAMPGE